VLPGGILRFVPEAGLVLSSPFARAWRTAEILKQTGWPAPVRCKELEPDCTPHKVLSVLARHEDLDSVVIVGHRPGLHELISCTS
jgi:phosphohistidine phosphatase SixA